jgi:hypothetical protein
LIPNKPQEFIQKRTSTAGKRVLWKFFLFISYYFISAVITKHLSSI